jgi:hypothetical protein
MEEHIVQSPPTMLGVKSHFLSKQYQNLNIIISSGRSKEFLGREVTIKDLDGMDEDRLEAYYKIYELNYANKIGESIITTIIGAYVKVVNKVLPIDDVDKLQVDLNNDYILTSELKNITGTIAATCGKLMSLFSLSFITMKHIKIQSKELCKEQPKELCKELCNDSKEISEVNQSTY